MKTLARLTAATGLLALVALPAQTQPAPQQPKVKIRVIQQKIQGQPIQKKIQAQAIQILPGRGAGRELNLLENTDVQKDLKLTPEQIKSVKDLVQKQNTALKGINGRQAFQKMRELAESNAKAVADLLKKPQASRLKQIQLQQRGPQAFLDRQVAQDLKLTEEQTGKIRTAIQQSRAKRAEAIKGANGNVEAAQKKVAELNKEISAEVVKDLTPEQKKKWQDLSGEPFKGTLPAIGPYIGVIQAIPAGVRPFQPLPRKDPNNPS